MSWSKFISNEMSKDYFVKMVEFIREDAKSHKIYPASKDVFNAFKYTPPSNVKVVIVGMDPYHQAEQAHGLSFSVPKRVDIPPSLRNIFKEIKSDLQLSHQFAHGCLESWAQQGVLLLNTTLTVRDSQPGSHSNIGWKNFTDAVIQTIEQLPQPIVFMLWGSFARSKKELIINTQHLVLEAAHPSPLSAYHGFLGCKHFSKANQFLLQHQLSPIDWTLPDE